MHFNLVSTSLSHLEFPLHQSFFGPRSIIPASWRFVPLPNLSLILQLNKNRGMTEWLKLLSAQRPGEKKTVFTPTRSAFEQDYDRIIFSSPFRMLQDKTQVFPLPKHDFVHTRLTHSLEVSSVGRSLGKNVGETILERHPELKSTGLTAGDFGAIVSAACLAHDLGNPPFGHSGEEAISEYFRSSVNTMPVRDMLNEMEWQDLTHFEGNAQGFRILNKNQYQGLRLTFATLAAFTKYPRGSHVRNLDPDRKSQKKFGFFQTEKDVFREVAEETGMEMVSNEKDIWIRHPLAFLVEAADDICYHIIDLEDGCNTGLIPFSQYKELLANIIGNRFKPEKLEKNVSIREKTGALRAMAIGELIYQSVEIFLDQEKSILSGDYDAALIEQVRTNGILKDIIKLSVEKIYRSASVTETEVAGFEVLDGLLNAFVPAIFRYVTEKERKARDKTLLRLISEDIRSVLIEEIDLYKAIRLCLDFIGSLTDSHALALFRRIKGIAL
jgi:dGTPase